MVQQFDFFNTINETGNTLKKSKLKALEQEAIIMRLFRKNKRGYTPFEVQELSLPNAPITSIRRAITNLTTRGLLRKTSELRLGKYGKPNYIWELGI